MDVVISRFPVSTQPIVLVSGIPAVGKSTYGRWLYEAKGVLNIDLENEGLERHGLADAWAISTSSAPASPDAFVQALRKLDCPVVVDWGYPMGWLPFVKAMHSVGVTAWWLDGDRAVARRRFVLRGTVSIQAPEVQMRGINAADKELRDFYGDRWLDIVRADGTSMDWDDVYTLMFGRSA